MSQMQQLLTEHIDIWTAADTGKKSGRGRASSNAGSVYGIRKLRELILELAVRGKLVPQDANDEPASELLKRILAEKTKLIAEGKIKKDKPLAEITEDEKPFKLPNGWQWARLNHFVLSIVSGGTPSKNNSEFWNGDIPWASVKDLNVGKFLESTQDFITKEGLDAGSKLADKGDLLICTRMGLGKIAIAAMNVAINQDLKALKITAFLDIDYFINFYGTLKIIGSGMTVAGIRQDELLGYCIPTPPLEEQHRIVAKVDELMALCDQLEAQHSNAADAHEQLVSHLLGTLTQSQDAGDFNTNWQRIATHFDTLFTTESSIDTLKQTLLQLAVMGKLVPQDPKDEPANELLKRLNGTKSSIEIKIPAKTKTTGIDHNKIPFQVPYNWRWEKLGNLVSDLRYGTSAKCEYEICGVPVLRIPNIGDEGITLEDLKFGNLTDEEQSNLNLKIGDALLIRSNGSASLVGKTALVSSESLHCAFAGYLVRLRIKVELLLPDYFQIIMKSPYIRGCIEGPVRTTSGVKNINSTEISNLHISLPSIPEQHRISDKVVELMTLCEQLKTRITDAKQCQKNLVDALIVHALVP